MEYQPQRALGLLRKGTGNPNATFREGQEEAIRHIVEGRGRLLVVQKTGWGKSFVYFIATQLLRENGAGPAILISPLLALMRNQVEAAERMGLRAERIDSSNQKQWWRVEGELRNNLVDILLVSPERLSNPHFTGNVLPYISSRLSLLVVDEAHCISDWGHDFRPDYRHIERVLRNLPPNLRVLATTATANDRVMDDLKSTLGQNLEVSRGDLNRDSLTLQTIRLDTKAERLAWLAKQLEGIEGSGIIYTLTKKDTEQISQWLKHKGFAVEPYHSRANSDHREDLEKALLNNKVKALVATSALGMGFDKPDLAFVLHYQTPGSVVHYYQQVGRAGRAISRAYGVLLSGNEELRITNWFIQNAFPTREEVAEVLAALSHAQYGLTLSELEEELNQKSSRIKNTLKLLSLESPSPIAESDKRYTLAPVPLQDSFWERAERLQELRRVEQRQMQTYLDLPFGKHMDFLIQALDGDPSATVPGTLPALPVDVCPKLNKEAAEFLRHTSYKLFDPRLQWPGSGRIPSSLRAQQGLSMCRWRDGGFGELVYQGKYKDKHFSDELVTNSKGFLDRWSPKPAPEWVTSIPSLRHPELVSNFAKRLAARLGLPYHEVLKQTKERPEQKEMENSSHQARNVYDSLGLHTTDLPKGPVLLVDDMVDSRWTFTVAAWLLRKHGAGPVWPFALANVSND